MNRESESKREIESQEIEEEKSEGQYMYQQERKTPRHRPKT